MPVITNKKLSHWLLSLCSQFSIRSLLLTHDTTTSDECQKKNMPRINSIV